MNKKGALTIRYVILFALALIVLVVIALIFYGGASNFAETLKGLFGDILAAKPENLTEHLQK